MPSKITTERIKEILEHCPEDPGSLADGLIGWENKERQMCAKCVGRIHARGCSNFVEGMTPVWDDQRKEIKCVTC